METRSIILGEFNSNGSYRSDFHEELGEETQPTHFFRDKKESRLFHLDHCFLSEAWAKRITRVEVGRCDGWHKFSDHVPLNADLNL